MITKAVFSNICNSIQEEISYCHESIYIAVAWFTNKELLGLLTEKVKSGIDVRIVVSDDIVNKRLNPKEFIKQGGKYSIKSSDGDRFLHHKFAIFDNKTVIIGSYNWTYFAEYKNRESVVISKDESLIKQFSIIFRQLNEKSSLYSDTSFDKYSDIGADKAEKEFLDLEKELKEQMLHAWEEAGKIDKKLQSHFILEYIENYGAIGACKRLMSTGTDRIQSGFIKMWEVNRIDLTFESIIVKDRFKILFDEKTINTALERLNKVK